MTTPSRCRWRRLLIPALTTALMRLREGTKPRIVFTTGHGEPSIDDMDVGHAALGLWRARLTATGSEVLAVNLLTQDVPDETALVVVVGPKSPFRSDEAARLKAFAERKKPVLLLLGDAETTGLEEFLKGFQVEIGPGFVVEPTSNYRGNPTTLLVPIVNAREPMIEPLNNEIVVLHRAAPLKIGNPAPGAAAVLPVVLLKTSPRSWAEPDLKSARGQKDPTDQAGPIPVAVAVNDRPAAGETRPGPPRLVVFSSRYMADNMVVQLAPANLDLLMNAVNALRGKAGSLGIPPKVHVAPTLSPDPVLKARLVLVPTVLSVLLIITLGVTTYLARRD